MKKVIGSLLMILMNHFEADAIVILTEWEEYKNINWDLGREKNEKTSMDF